jgi:hypothetical protein
MQVDGFLDEKKEYMLKELDTFLSVGDLQNGPKSDILGQASAGIRTDRSLDFPA